MKEAFKKEVSRYKKQSSILKKSFAVQIKVRKVATKLQNVSPSTRSLLRGYITQLFIGTQTYFQTLNFTNWHTVYKTLPTPGLGHTKLNYKQKCENPCYTAHSIVIKVLSLGFEASKIIS